MASQCSTSVERKADDRPRMAQDSRAFAGLTPLLRHLRAVLSLAAWAEDEPPHLQRSSSIHGEPAPDGEQQQQQPQMQQQQQREEQPTVQPLTNAAPVADPAAAQQDAAAAAGGAPAPATASAAALRAAVEAVAEEVAAEAGGADERLQAMQAAQELIEQYMQFADRIHEGERKWLFQPSHMRIGWVSCSTFACGND